MLKGPVLDRGELKSVKRISEFLLSLGIADSLKSAQCLVHLYASLEPEKKAKKTKTEIRSDEDTEIDFSFESFSNNYLDSIFPKKLKELPTKDKKQIEHRMKLFEHGMRLGKANDNRIFKKLLDLNLLYIGDDRRLRIDTLMFLAMTGPKDELKGFLQSLFFDFQLKSAPWFPQGGSGETVPIINKNVVYIAKSPISNLKFENNHQAIFVHPQVFSDAHPITLIALSAEGYHLVIESTSRQLKKKAHQIERVAPISLVILLAVDNDRLETELYEAIEEGLVKPRNFIVESGRISENNKKGNLSSVKESVLKALKCNLASPEDLNSIIAELEGVQDKIKKNEHPLSSQAIGIPELHPSPSPIYRELICCDNEPGELDRVVNLLKYRPDHNIKKHIILISGAPGTGKTAFAQILGYPKISRFRIGESRDDSYYAGIERRVLQEYRNCDEDTLFQVDEAEGMIANRQGLTDNAQGQHYLSLINTFLTILDPSLSGRSVILTTNDPRSVDPAVLSRLSCHLKFREPGLSQLKMAFMIYWRQLSGLYIEPDLDFIIEKSFEPLLGQISLRHFAVAARIYSASYAETLCHDPFNYLRLILNKVDN